MIATRTRESLVEQSEIGGAVSTTAITSCRYCPQLDHWVPVTGLETAAAGIRHADGQIVIGIECPVCSGVIPAYERDVECRFCDNCLQYVPLRLWDRHCEQICCG